MSYAVLIFYLLISVAFIVVMGFLFALNLKAIREDKEHWSEYILPLIFSALAFFLSSYLMNILLALLMKGGRP